MKVGIVTPCMGRLHHLRRTIERASRECDLYCLVDYSCPHKSGDWVDTNGPHNAIVVRVPGQSHFNKCAAHNAGAMHAIALGTEILCFVDADTVVSPGFYRFLAENVQPGQFVIANTHSDLTGFLGVYFQDFSTVGGFDAEEWQDWGAEDLDMRLRLYFQGLSFVIAPSDLLSPIEHDDAERTAYYHTSDIRISRGETFDRLLARFHTFTGNSRWIYDPNIQILLGGRMGLQGVNFDRMSQITKFREYSIKPR